MQYYLPLVALLGHSLAAFNNHSGTGHVDMVQSSVVPSSDIPSSSAFINTEEGCVVQLYVVNAYDWNPVVDFRTSDNSEQITDHTSVATNSAGTQTTTVEWISGAYVRHGAWSLLTATTTL